MIDSTHLASAFVLGLMGGAHCIAMCGGIIGALSLGVDARRTSYRLWLLVLYNMGRLAGYSLIGALLFITLVPAQYLVSLWVFRLIAGFIMIVSGLYLGGWWLGLQKLEALGQHAWQYIQPLTRRCLPVDKPYKAIMLGFLWGWLPCGLVYTALALSSTAASVQQAMLTMLVFGIGTLPAVLGSGIVANTLKLWLQKPWLRTLFAIVIIIMGVVTMAMAHPLG